jgi:hypothetical protein
MANEITKTDALLSLKPNAEWVLRGDTLEWLDEEETEPSSDAIAAEVTRLQSIYDNNDYQRTRAAAYPELKEQLDLLYKDMLADKGDKTGTWFAAVKAVKDATAKPE